MRSGALFSLRLLRASTAMAGSVSAPRPHPSRLLSGDADRSDRHQPRDVLRSVSALTTGIFAVLVTLAV